MRCCERRLPAQPGEAEIMDRLLSARSGVPLKAVQSKLKGEQVAAVVGAGERFAGESFELDDSPGNPQNDAPK